MHVWWCVGGVGGVALEKVDVGVGWCARMKGVGGGESEKAGGWVVFMCATEKVK